MNAASSLDVTKLLRDWTGGDQSARERLLPAVYEPLRRTAAAYMPRERGGHTLQAIDLINEAYLRVVALTGSMARSRIYLKRGGGARPITLDECMA